MNPRPEQKYIITETELEKFESAMNRDAGGDVYQSCDTNRGSNLAHEIRFRKIIPTETPLPPRDKHLLYLDKSTPDEFINTEIMDWIYLVGDISTEYELNFVRQFGHALKTRISNTITDEELKEYCSLKASENSGSFTLVSKVEALAKKYENEIRSRTEAHK